MSRRPAVDTGTGSDKNAAGESTPLLGNEATSNGDGDEGHDSTGSSQRRSSLPPLKTLESYSGGVSTSIMNAMGMGALRRRLSSRMQRDEDLNIYSMASLAIVMSYFSVGVALELLYTPIASYLIDGLGAESGVYTVWVILVTLPWSFKVSNARHRLGFIAA